MSALVTLSTHPHTWVQTVTPAAWPGIGGEDFLSEQQKCLPLISKRTTPLAEPIC